MPTLRVMFIGALCATRADTEATEANLHEARVAAIADVARAYFELRGAQRQLDIARENARIQERSSR